MLLPKATLPESGAVPKHIYRNFTTIYRSAMDFLDTVTLTDFETLSKPFADAVTVIYPVPALSPVILPEPSTEQMFGFWLEKLIIAPS